MLISIIHRVNRAQGLNLDPLSSGELRKMQVGKGRPWDGGAWWGCRIMGSGGELDPLALSWGHWGL